VQWPVPKPQPASGRPWTRRQAFYSAYVFHRLFSQVTTSWRQGKLAFTHSHLQPVIMTTSLLGQSQGTEDKMGTMWVGLRERQWCWTVCWTVGRKGLGGLSQAERAAWER
jgi:hypothetical protein